MEGVEGDPTMSVSKIEDCGDIRPKSFNEYKK